MRTKRKLSFTRGGEDMKSPKSNKSVESLSNRIYEVWISKRDLLPKDIHNERVFRANGEFLSAVLAETMMNFLEVKGK